MKTRRQHRVHVITMGCAKNVVDSEKLVAQLRLNSIEVVPALEDADIAIVNTCGFIQAAKEESLDAIFEQVKRKAKGKLKRVYAMGCLTERYRSDLQREIPEVDRLFGSNEAAAILQELGGRLRTELLGERVLSTPSHTAFLKISEGCDNPCSFCAIPLMRGGHASRPMENILDEATALAAGGVRELVVIGQDTTYYGLDRTGTRALGMLLERLAEIPGILWVRLMYAFPAKFPLDVLDVMKDHPRICKYIDMPIQHSADVVLKSMRRGISGRALRELIEAIRTRVPGITLRTTLIVGYPNEGVAEFEDLLRFVEETRFERLGVFPYSEEEGTTAAPLGDPIELSEKARRRDAVMQLQQEISDERNAGLVGSTQTVLIDRHEGGYAVGRTEADAPEVDNEVIVLGDRLPAVGTFSRIDIVEAYEYDLVGHSTMPPERRWAAAILWMAFAALVFAPHGARGQVEASAAQTDPRDEHFYLDAVSFADQTGSSRLDVFVQVGYELLTFIKSDQVYDASYEITLSIYDSLKTLITEKSWVEEVKGVTFDQSVSPNLYSLTQRVFSVPPGGYEVAASVRDNETKTLHRRVRRLLVSEYGTPQLALSDIMIVSRVTERAGKKAMVPNVSGNVGGIPEAFFAYLEAYNRLRVDSLKFVTNAFGEKGESKLEVDTVVAMKPGRNDFLFRIPHASLTLGDYRLVVRAYSRDSVSNDPDAYLATTDRPLSVRWRYFPVGVKSLDLAIAQVRYIARDNEFDVLEEAKTEEEKQAKLLEFWKRRDPNPNTDRNERMEEYYRRADYANKNFTHHREGWRTDMGMVYMMFGPPSDVARHPFELDTKPYEVWRYYDINYDFVFVDDTGFGDYRLITPIWEAWQRVK